MHKNQEKQSLSKEHNESYKQYEILVTCLSRAFRWVNLGRQEQKCRNQTNIHEPCFAISKYSNIVSHMIKDLTLQKIIIEFGSCYLSNLILLILTVYFIHVYLYTTCFYSLLFST